MAVRDEWFIVFADAVDGAVNGDLNEVISYVFPFCLTAEIVNISTQWKTLEYLTMHVLF